MSVIPFPTDRARPAADEDFDGDLGDPGEDLFDGALADARDLAARLMEAGLPMAEDAVDLATYLHALRMSYGARTVGLRKCRTWLDMRPELDEPRAARDASNPLAVIRREVDEALRK